ncbi:MAG: hypothetical protein WD972_02155 [Candidatus Andersenbacteria bacterium]
MSVDPLWFAVWADIFSNLAAGWFAAVVIVPVTTTRPTPVKLSLLAVNSLFGA